MGAIIIITLVIVCIVYGNPPRRTPRVCEGCGDTNPDWEVYVWAQPTWSKKRPKVAGFKCKKCGHDHSV